MIGLPRMTPDHEPTNQMWNHMQAIVLGTQSFLHVLSRHAVCIKVAGYPARSAACLRVEIEWFAT